MVNTVWNSGRLPPFHHVALLSTRLQALLSKNALLNALSANCSRRGRIMFCNRVRNNNTRTVNLSESKRLE